MIYLLDTCVLSELAKSKPHQNVTQWLRAQSADALRVSVMALAELEYGVQKLIPGSARRVGLQRWLDGIFNTYAARVLPITSDIAREWGALTGGLARTGVTLPIMDAWMTATAHVHGCTLATRNVSDMARCGAMVLNPWEA